MMRRVEGVKKLYTWSILNVWVKFECEFIKFMLDLEKRRDSYVVLNALLKHQYF